MNRRLWTRLLLPGLLLPALCSAQLALFSFEGATETPVGATFNYGNIATGSTASVRFRAFNQGNSAVVLSTLAVAGTGFSPAPGNNPVPYTIAPGNFLEFTINFAAGALATYSASLQVNSISVILLATSVAAPVLTVFPSCLPNANTSVIDFPPVTIGTVGGCNFSLQNPGNQTLAISTLAVTGAGFQGAQGIETPLTLAGGQAITFSIQITPVCGTLNYTGALTVNTQTFGLSAIGLTPPLPKPSFTFDAQNFANAQQHAVGLTLPSASVCASTSGYLNLAFTPASGTGQTDDLSVIFLAGSVRTLPFSVAANSTQILINGQTSAAFQTGTTAGTITFTLSSTSISGAPTATIAIPPAPIFLETTAASNQTLGQLNIEVIGYDNTYSAGAMSFTFFDATGKTIGSAIAADFTSNFKSYFASAAGSGSSFLMRVSFPVEGPQTQVATVQATLTNSAGPAQTGSLTFQ